MTIINKPNKYFSEFIVNANKHIQEYNKKNKKTPLPKIDENWVNELETPLNTLVFFDILFKDKDLHFHLVLLLDLIRSYILNRKIHPNEIKTLFRLKEYALHQYKTIELHHKLEFNREKLRHPARILYGSKDFARHRIKEWGDMLISKVIDYLPRDVKDERLNTLIDAVVGYKNYLEFFINADVHYWVYPFTEDYSYIPFNLKLLNEYDKLGSKIENWQDSLNEHTLEVYLQEKGFNPLYGWGEKITAANNSVTKPVASSTDNTEKVVKLSRQVSEDLGLAIYKHIQMYVHCDKFTLNNPKHRNLLARTISYVVQHYTNGNMVSYGTLKVVFDQVRSFMNKKVKTVSVPKFQTRRDKKLWLIPEFIPQVLEMMRIVIASRVQLFVSETIAHAFDVCIPSGEDFKEVIAAHKDYIVRSHNRVYNTEDKWTNKEIEDALKLYQYVLLPEYKELTEPETHWVFLSTLGLWLNVGDEAIVEDIYNKLKDYFEKRHTAEENETVVNRDLQYVKMMSYKNKASLLKRLTDNPIQLVSYAGSKEIYNDMIAILEKDVYKPDMTFSDKKISITENGIVVS